MCVWGGGGGGGSNLVSCHTCITGANNFSGPILQFEVFPSQFPTSGISEAMVDISTKNK